jgi:hypothetical protein
VLHSAAGKKSGDTAGAVVQLTVGEGSPVGVNRCHTVWKTGGALLEIRTKVGQVAQDTACRLLSTKAAMAFMVSKFSTPASWASTSIP